MMTKSSYLKEIVIPIIIGLVIVFYILISTIPSERTILIDSFSWSKKISIEKMEVVTRSGLTLPNDARLITRKVRKANSFRGWMDSTKMLINC